MKTHSERPTPRLQDTELQPICRHGTDAQPTGHAQQYRPPQIGSDSTARRPMGENGLSRPSGCAPAPWIAARAATTDIPRNYLIRARQRAPRRTATRTPLRYQPITRKQTTGGHAWSGSRDGGADPGDERFPNRTNPVTARPSHRASGIAPIAESRTATAVCRLAYRIGNHAWVCLAGSLRPLGPPR